MTITTDLAVPFNSESFQGAIASDFYSEELVKNLSKIMSLLSSPQAIKLSKGADYVVKCPMQIKGQDELVAIKVFKRQSIWKDWYDFKHKSKAERSFNAANFLQTHQIGTPAPIAFLDKWQGKRLIENFKE